MNKERIDDLVDILGEEYAKIENTFVIRNNEQLFKYLENPEKWKARQLASRNHYRAELIKEAKARLDILNAKTEKVYLLSYREIAKDQIEITEHEIVAKDIPESVKKDILKMQQFNAKQVVELANQSLKTYTKQVRIIDQISTADNLYDVVKDYTRKGIENGVKVVYRNKRQVTWKSYMEMNIRTTVHQEISNRQVEVGASVGQIFYYCDSFGDSAPDHAPYQGKYYYNEDSNIPTEVMNWIKLNHIESMQSVMNKPPYLTMRPNCRHNFHAVPIEEAMGTPAPAWGEKNDLNFGEYKGSNYQKLQQQRYNERMIRKWKLEKESQQAIAKETGLKDTKKVKEINAKITEYQRRNQMLVASSDGLLVRDYSRETAKVIVDNLGVKYDYKVVGGQLERK